MFFQEQSLANRRQLLRLAAAAGALTLPLAGRTQSTWPTKPVNLIVPFPAGGGTDAFARPLSAQFAKQTGKTMVIDNRGGAGGTLGAGIAAKAAPDGYTLFMGAVHHAIAPSMYPKLDYDIEKDFVPLVLMANVPQVLVVNPKSVSGDFKAFVAQLKASPGRLNYGSAGTGTSHHLAGELFKQQTGTFITHIPYTGAGPAVVALLGGQIDAVSTGPATVLQHVKAGKVRILGHWGSGSLAALPDVPALKDAGFNAEYAQWSGLFIPAATPEPVAQRLRAAARTAAQDPKVREVIQGSGSPVLYLDTPEFEKYVKADVRRLVDVVKRIGKVE